MKEIDLENMTGEEFEILCQEIFSKYYSVKVDRTPLVGDGGKDLIIRFEEPVYVECKHHKSTIGRPVVQKLHSAMVTDWVKKGIIVTTGEFSPQAIKHIKDNNLPIELIDGHRLEEMAASVGIKIYFGYDVNLNEVVIDRPSQSSVMEALSNQVKKMRAGPAQIDSFCNLDGYEVIYQPYYAVDYNIDQEFYNSKKTVLIGSIKTSGTVLLDADSLKLYPPANLSFFMAGEFLPSSEMIDPPHLQPKHIRSDVEQAMYDQLIWLNTKEVTYRSTNDKKYTRTLAPARNHIQLSGFRVIHLPTVHVRYTTYGTLHQFYLFYNGKAFAKINGDRCAECQNLPVSPTICCSCGKIYCAGHTKQCSLCDRPVCKKCLSKYKINIIKSGIACKECRGKNPNLKYKM